MNKIAFFGVNTLALNILSVTNLNKDLIVTLDEEGALKNRVSDFRNDLKQLDFNHIYNCNSYSLKAKSDREYFKEYSGDIGVILGWNRLIPENIIKSFKYGILGFHGTPYQLPRGRGRSPVIWSLALDEKKYYYYLFQITEGIDDGPIWSEKMVDINEFDNISSLYKKLATIAVQQIDEVIPKIEANELSPRAQPSGEPTYFPKRGFEDGKIDWNSSTNKIYNLIRAITEPYPCAHTFINDDIVKIIRATPFSDILFRSRKPGEICSIYDDGSFVVKTCDGTLLVSEYLTEREIKINQILS